MARHTRWLAAVAAMALLAACGGGDDKSEVASIASDSAPAATASSLAAGTPAATATPATLDYTRLEKYIPSDEELPDRVSYQARVDLSNEAAANNAADLKMFQDTGRVTGIQFFFNVEAGARTVSIGVSYYNNTDEPKKLLRRSGDPAAVTAPGRFQIPGLGDEYLAARLRLGSGEGAAHIINIAWVRGPFFISLADLGGTPDTPADVAVKLAQLIDAKLNANPVP